MATSRAGSLRYEYSVDPETDSVATKILHLVGAGTRVLDLGCGPGSLARELADRGCSVVGVERDPLAAKRAEQFCEEVLLADLDTADLGELLGERRFDVVLAADVLEHLREPAGILAQTRALLTPSGYAVVSAPNVAHASVRLALLGGTFPYGDTGLLDRTHLHFWTRESLARLFEDAGFTVVQVLGQRLGIFDSEVPVPDAARSPELVAAATRDPDALVYQFVVLAVPARAPGEDAHERPPLVERLAELLQAATRERAAAEERAAQLAAELARYTGTDPLAPDGMPAPETVAALLSTRDELHRVQTQLMLVEQQLENRSEALRRTEGERVALQARVTAGKAEVQAAEAARAAAQAELDAIHSSRLWALAQVYRRVRALAAGPSRAPRTPRAPR